MNRLAWVLMTVVVASGCGGAGTKKKLELLDEAILHYNQALRWGRYTDAQEYHVTRDGAHGRIDPALLGSIRITGMSVQSKDVNDEVTEATVTGEISYYRTEQGMLRQLPLNQSWWFELESRRWLIQSEPPVFK